MSIPSNLTDPEANPVLDAVRAGLLQAVNDLLPVGGMLLIAFATMLSAYFMLKVIKTQLQQSSQITMDYLDDMDRQEQWDRENNLHEPWGDQVNTDELSDFDESDVFDDFDRHRSDYN